MTDEEKFLCRCACRRCTKQSEEECKTCEYNYYDKEGKRMRLIDADALKAYFRRPYSNEETYTNTDIEQIINNLPTIEERPQGKWEYLKEHITEMRDANGELNQKQTCNFILELMGVIEREGEAE